MEHESVEGKVLKGGSASPALLPRVSIKLEEYTKDKYRYQGFKVAKGGSTTDSLIAIRLTFRAEEPTNGHKSIGFRVVVRDVSSKKQSIIQEQ